MQDKIRETDEKIKSALKSTPATEKQTSEPSAPSSTSQVENPDDSEKSNDSGKRVEDSKEKKQAVLSHVTFSLDDKAASDKFTTPHPSSGAASETCQVTFAASPDDTEEKKEKLNR